MLADPHVQFFFWSGATVGLYFTVKAAHRKTPRWFLMPLVVTPALLIAAALLLRTSYRDYLAATHWLMALLGPATVAFAVPIYQHRAVIRGHWQVLAIASLAGSLTATGTAWLLASAFGVDGALRLSLLPRSISTPFAMTVSADIGGIPELTAIFVVLTGLAGAVIGELMLLYVPVRSAIARGTLLGMGAHGAGTAKAYEIGPQEGSIAGLTMVLVGLLNVLLAPLLVQCAGGLVRSATAAPSQARGVLESQRRTPASTEPVVPAARRGLPKGRISLPGGVACSLVAARSCDVASGQALRT